MLMLRYLNIRGSRKSLFSAERKDIEIIMIIVMKGVYVRILILILMYRVFFSLGLALKLVSIQKLI